jgi:hypothetical protein
MTKRGRSTFVDVIHAVMTGAADYDLINLLYYSAGVYSIQGLADAREALEDDIVNILTLDVDVRFTAPVSAPAGANVWLLLVADETEVNGIIDASSGALAITALESILDSQFVDYSYEIIDHKVIGIAGYTSTGETLYLTCPLKASIDLTKFRPGGIASTSGVEGSLPALSLFAIVECQDNLLTTANAVRVDGTIGYSWKTRDRPIRALLE